MWDKTTIKESDQEKKSLREHGMQDHGILQPTSPHSLNQSKRFQSYLKKEIGTSEAERTLVVVTRIQSTGYLSSKVIMD